MNWLTSTIGIAAFIGFADSIYLSAVRYLGWIPDCKIVSGCEEVLSSPYAVTAGIPVSVLGIIYYTLILILLNLYFSKPIGRWINLIRLCATIGMVTVLYFLYIQAFVLNAWCVYCLVSAAASAVIFIGSFSLKYKMENKGGVVI